MGQSLHWCTEITLKHVSFPTDEPSYCWKRLLSWETLSVNANSSYGSVNFKHARRPCPWPFLGHFSCFLRNTARIAPWNKHRVQMSHPWDKKTMKFCWEKLQVTYQCAINVIWNGGLWRFIPDVFFYNAVSIVLHFCPVFPFNAL